MREETFLNRDGYKISTTIEESNPSKGLVILTHGLGKTKDMPVLEIISKTFNSQGYTTLRFDMRNTYGKSEGNFEDATITNYYEDIEDTIKWAEKQPWYKEKITLVGHSMGASAAGLATKNSPSKIKTLILLSPVVSGELSSENYPQPLLENWEKLGFFEWNDNGKSKKLKWQFILDARNYDLTKEASSLTMPVLIISGENDTDTPTRHHKILYDKLPSIKEIKIIKNGTHHFNGQEELAEIQTHINNWISKFA